MIKIIIVDDQSLMRDGLEIILNSCPQIEVAACGTDGSEAVKLTEKIHPDLVLMDIRMPIMDGVEASKIIKKTFPDVKILLLTTFDDEELIISAVSAGVSGYVFKDIEKDKLIEAIKDCIKGTFIMPSRVAQVLANHIPDIKSEYLHNNNINDKNKYTTNVEDTNNKESSDDELRIKNQIIAEKLGLTEREMQIAMMIAQGFTNHQIASALYISDGTVKNYVSSIYSKTEMKDRLKLALYLKGNGIK
ncbi:MAG: response regulator transcription factor [Bacillota bacterium]|nr:response regulator transcription factor [Bacillota bacterium]